MKTKWWLLLLAATMLAAWWAGRWLQAPVAVRLAPDPSCDVGRAPCALALPDGGGLSLSLAPLPPRVMQPMRLRVELSGAADAVWVDFVGINMDMGLNRAELSPQGAGLWEGQVVLPICSAAEMLWEARVMVQSGGGIEAPFRFTTRP